MSLEGEILAAVKQGNLDMVRMLISFGADVNTRNALLTAIKQGNLDMVKILLSHRSGTNPDDKTALRVAIGTGNILIAKLLEAKGISADQGGLLCLAVRASRLSSVLYLVSRGVSVDARDPRGGSAINYAIKDGRPMIAEFLLDMNASLPDLTEVTDHALKLEKRKAAVKAKGTILSALIAVYL